MKNETKVMKGSYKPAQRKDASYSGKSTPYAGSDLKKNLRPGKSPASRYQGNNLKSYKNGYSQSTAYKGNDLNISANVSKTQGAKNV